MPVFRVPLVGILNTGNELLAPGKRITEGKIFNSNYPMLAALITQENCRAKASPVIAFDQLEHMQVELNCLLMETDLVIVTGGTAQGDADWTRDTLSAIRASILFDHLQVKPGPGTTAAWIGGKLVICLPGNPGAGSILFKVLVAPILKKLSGCSQVENGWFPITLCGEIRRRDEHRSLRWGELIIMDGELYGREWSMERGSPQIGRVLLDLAPFQGNSLDRVRAMMA